MMQIAWPWMAALLPLPWLHYLWRRRAQPSGVAIFLPFAAGLDWASGGVVAGGYDDASAFHDLRDLSSGVGGGDDGPAAG